MTTPLQLGWGFYRGVPVSPIQAQTIRQGVNQGLSLNTIQRSLQHGGIGIRRGAIIEFRQEILGSFDRKRALRSVRNEFRPTRRVLTPTRIVTKGKFRVWGEITVKSPVTGELSIVPANFGYTDEMSIGEIKTHLEELAQERIGSLFLEALDTQLNVITIQELT